MAPPDGQPICRSRAFGAGHVPTWRQRRPERFDPVTSAALMLLLRASRLTRSAVPFNRSRSRHLTTKATHPKLWAFEDGHQDSRDIHGESVMLGNPVRTERAEVDSLTLHEEDRCDEDDLSDPHDDAPSSRYLSFRRCDQYLFIRRLTARLAAADIRRRRPVGGGFRSFTASGIAGLTADPKRR